MKVDTDEKIAERELLIEPIQIRGELDVITYLPLPSDEQAHKNRLYFPSSLFIVMVIAPLLLALIYNFLLATERYSSTASFVVRESKQGSGLASVIDGGGLGRSDENSYAVTEFVKSRDAIESVNSDGFLTNLFSKPEIDIFSRFPSILSGDGKEDFFLHFQHYVDVDFDVSTGITTLSVQAFSPQDAQELASRIVGASEELVNALNARAQRDATHFSRQVVEENRKALADVQLLVTQFRNENKMLNADSEVAVSTKLIAGLLQSITAADTEIQILSKTPNNPRLSELRLRRQALSDQLEKLRQTLAGGDGSIAKKLEQFEALTMRQRIAETQLITAEAALIKATHTAATEKLYLDNVVAPNVPDKFGYPTRFLNIALVLFVSGAAYVVVTSLRDLILEE